MTTVAQHHPGIRHPRRHRRLAIVVASAAVATAGLLAVSGTMSTDGTAPRRSTPEPVAATTPSFVGMTPDAAIRWSEARRSSHAGMSPDAAERWRHVRP